MVLAAVAALGLRHWISVTRRTTIVRLATLACVVLYGFGVAGVSMQIDASVAETESIFVIVGAILFFGLFVLLASFCTAFGLVPLAGRALVHTLRDLRNSFQLQARSMPMLLFLTLFFFFTGELWQLAGRLTWGRESFVIAIFATVTVFTSGARLRDEIAQIEDGLSTDVVITACRGTPLEGSAACLSEWRAAAPLTRTQSLNLLLLLASRQLAQATVVGIGMFLFFVSMGLVLIDPETMHQWIGSPPSPSHLLPAVPGELLRVSLLLAGFSSMYFVVSTMVDPHYRKQFFPPVIRELERALAVRTVYLAIIGDGVAPARRPGRLSLAIRRLAGR
ncbi:hypothetical protein AB0B45_30365 [Nonomuraea sp. NPDC049152]|uniref:hypothetical protein n=1 Tax=Nonomuraea sp. NPDC049152 TaxID=3154350 RepID=UPI0033CB5594